MSSADSYTVVTRRQDVLKPHEHHKHVSKPESSVSPDQVKLGEKTLKHRQRI